MSGPTSEGSIHAGGVTRESSQLQNHTMRLEDLLNNLERASLQFDNALARLRGRTPETSPIDSPDKLAQTDPPLINKMSDLANHLHCVGAKLNNFADELNEYI